MLTAQVPDVTDYTMVGRTYRYYNGHPLYPFGYGLSYSTFQYSGLSVTPKAITPDQNVTVKVTVMNSGSKDSDEVIRCLVTFSVLHLYCHLFEVVALGSNTYMYVYLYILSQVVQVYVSWSNHSVPVPKLQLVGFKRVRIAAGQTAALMFTIVPEQLRVWMDDTTGWGHLTGTETSCN